MYEKDRIKRILLRNSLLFFAVFFLIFAVLGIFIYQAVSENIYRSADQQLLSPNFGEATLIIPANTFNDENIENSGRTENDSEEQTEEAARGTSSNTFSFDSFGEERDSVHISISSVVSDLEENPTVFYLLRNEEGELIEATGLYGNRYREFADSVPFDPNQLGTIYQIEVSGKQYRSVSNYLYEPAGTSYYLQALINVDSEIAILNQFTQTLVISLLLALIACAVASYFLSKRTIRPIAQAWEKQTEFIQNASHELRTPLAVIHTTQELLLEDPKGTIMDHFEDINLTLEESKRLRRLAEELLTLSAVGSETDSPQEEFDLDQLLNDIAGRYKDFSHVQEKTLSIDSAVHSEIRADRSKIERAVNCVLENAFSYTEDGDTIGISSSRVDDQAIIIICDTGIGIPAKDRERVFERFYRADKARSRTTEGTGLGLSIARDLIESQRGTITIDSNEPKGTRVTITLPLQ